MCMVVAVFSSINSREHLLFQKSKVNSVEGNNLADSDFKPNLKSSRHNDFLLTYVKLPKLCSGKKNVTTL